MTSLTIRGLPSNRSKALCLSWSVIYKPKNQAIYKLDRTFVSVFTGSRGKNDFWAVFSKRAVTAKNVSVVSVDPELVMHFPISAFHVLK